MLIDGAPNNTIGGTYAGARNIMADNTSGVVITGVTAVGNLVEGNYLGTDASGKVIAANSNYGVQIAGGSDNTIGGLTPGAGNVISGNNLANVAIGSSRRLDLGNVIEGNLIGTNPEGTAALPAINPFGLEITDSPGNVVVANVISGNAGVGLAVLGQSSTGTVIQCNKIGTDFTGTASVPNSGNGLLISDDSGVVIGGMALGDGNLISGNGGNGVDIGDGWAGVVLLGNGIGTDASGGRRWPTGRWGARQQLGGRHGRRGGSGSANLISGNGGSGVGIEGAGSSGSVVLGNRIGVVASGLLSVPNGGDGVLIDGCRASRSAGVARDRQRPLGQPGQGVHVLAPAARARSSRGMSSASTFRDVRPSQRRRRRLPRRRLGQHGRGDGRRSQEYHLGQDLNGVGIAGAGATANDVLGNLIGATVDYLNPSVTHGLAVGNKADGVKIDGTFDARATRSGGRPPARQRHHGEHRQRGRDLQGRRDAPDRRCHHRQYHRHRRLDGSSPRAGQRPERRGPRGLDGHPGRRGDRPERNVIAGNARTGPALFLAECNLIRESTSAPTPRD